MSKKKIYMDELVAQDTMYVVNHMKLRDHQVSVIFHFFDDIKSRRRTSSSFL
ncbi:hypothetical protein [Bacillus mycoides]|uniref:hypothetical protein n=1 Tax=Bacillus mycoides TaxID=1405 RepID=UPI001F36C7D1|nr:hypothetical protein [Bacillus mycoides]